MFPYTFSSDSENSQSDSEFTLFRVRFAKSKKDLRKRKGLTMKGIMLKMAVTFGRNG